MNEGYNASYEDRIEFVIALMTKDYAKACDIGARLVKHNQHDVNVISVLDILKRRNQHELKESDKLYSVDNPIESDSEYEVDDVSDDEDSDSVNNVDICINAKITKEITSPNMGRLKNCRIYLNADKGETNLDFKQKMHRVIPIKINKK